MNHLVITHKLHFRFVIGPSELLVLITSLQHPKTIKYIRKISAQIEVISCIRILTYMREQKSKIDVHL